MKLKITNSVAKTDLIIINAFNRNNKLDIPSWDKSIQADFKANPASKFFKGNLSETVYFSGDQNFLVLGLGDSTKVTLEVLRKAFAKVYHEISMKYKSVTVGLDGLTSLEELSVVGALSESFLMSAYSFDIHKSNKIQPVLTDVSFLVESATAKLRNEIKRVENIVSSINIGRDFMNEAPNVLNSVEFAKRIEKDIAKVGSVKTKILNKAQIKKEKMGLFLSVNAGSAYEPRLVHLTYTPKKVTKNTKHIAFVGKGLTFDTGGYSLKPSSSMVTMKYDMGGAATVYAAFRALVLNNSSAKISCFIGMTDNAVNSLATMPDSIVKARNGKSVEILNTDAEGRLVLADVLDYACDFKPDHIVDCATLTGAVLVALGNETCGLFSNSDELSGALLDSAHRSDEYMWRLPIIQEHKDDIKSPIADLKNMGSSRFGGSAKAGAFLEEFIKNDISWAHLDVAGIASDQGHLPYCPKKGSSGLIVRTLVDFVNSI